MKLITLDQIEFPKIVDCFNLAFSDYFIKFQVNETYLRTRWHGANMHYSMSAGVLDNNELVGFIVIGIGERGGLKASYNGGTGVIPTHRGRGYTTKMYEFLMPKFKTVGVKTHLLEVIQQNEKAIHLYKKQGMKIARGLNSFSGEIQIDKKRNPQIECRKIKKLDWSLVSTYKDYEPAWDFTTIAIMRNIQNYTIYGAYLKDQLVGYTLVKNADGMIMQFGVDSKMRRQGIGSTLFYFIKKDFPNIKIVNVDDRQIHVLKFIKHIGLNNTINQYEMVSYL